MISRKSDYALRALIYLALNKGKLISAREIAEKLKIPYKFLTQIFLDLSHKEIVASQRGSKGGVILKKDPSELSLLEVIEAIDGPITLHQCATELDEPCFFEGKCPLKEKLEDLEEVVRQLLANATFAKIIEEYQINERREEKT
jgi:Rrf2 family protein